MMRPKTDSLFLQNNWTRPVTTDSLPRNSRKVSSTLQIQRSMSSHSRNTKGRMELLDDTLVKIGSHVNGLRIQTKVKILLILVIKAILFIYEIRTFE